MNFIDTSCQEWCYWQNHVASNYSQPENLQRLLKVERENDLPQVRRLREGGHHEAGGRGSFCTSGCTSLHMLTLLTLTYSGSIKILKLPPLTKT